MFKTLGLWTCGLALALALCVSEATAGTGSLAGTPNPDAANIIGEAGAQTIQILPRDYASDWRNLQWAFDNVGAGGTVKLEAGVFDLGDGAANLRRTVVMRRGLRVAGTKDGASWRTVIQGGGEVMLPGVGGRIESGPFRVVNEDDPHPAVFEDLWFRGWACEVVFIEACQGFEMRRCRLSDPVNTAIENNIRFVHAIWSSGPKTQGDFILENNLVEMGRYDGERADDEQLLGIFYSNHDTVRIVDNVIIGMDEAIEIIGNRYEMSTPEGAKKTRVPAEIVVTGNRIDVTQTPGRRWPSTFAILIAGNLGAEAVRIEDNDLTVRGKGFAFGLSGERFNITGNTIRFEEHEGKYPAGLMTIGFGKLAGRSMGASLVDSVYKNNTIEGKVRDFGIVFRPGSADMPNISHGNRFDLGDSVAKLGAKATLTLSKDVFCNTFTGGLGTVVDNSPEDANEYQSR